jgi:hypothetical protein
LSDGLGPRRRLDLPESGPQVLVLGDHLAEEAGNPLGARALGDRVQPHGQEQQVVVRVVALLDARPEDPHSAVEAAEFFREAPADEFVFETTRRADGRERDDPGHSCQAPR